MTSGTKVEPSTNEDMVTPASEFSEGETEVREPRLTKGTWIGAGGDRSDRGTGRDLRNCRASQVGEHAGDRYKSSSDSICECDPPCQALSCLRDWRCRETRRRMWTRRSMRAQAVI